MKRIFSFVLVTALLICAMPAAAAAGYTSSETFWSWIAGNGGIIQEIVGLACGSACPSSDDGHHHANSYIKDLKQSGYYECICTYCGDKFKAYASDLEQAYNDSVAALPGSGYDSDGAVYIVMQHRYLSVNYQYKDYFCEHGDNPLSSDVGTLTCTDVGGYFKTVSSNKSALVSIKVMYGFVAPFDGTYYFPDDYSCFARGTYADGSVVTITKASLDGNLRSNYSPRFFVSGDNVSAGFSFSPPSNAGFVMLRAFASPPQVKAVPDTPLSAQYEENTRAGSMSGDFGILNNGTYTKIDGNYIVNETNNTVYNPVTKTTTKITNWTYDYSDRSYHITTEDNSNQTIIYGDQYVTIKEGDTVYNIYYITNDSESETPSSCDHDYTAEVTTEATCEAPGLRTYTCSKCQHSYTEKIPATGHSWQVKQSVQTEYDDTGNITQQGYTIYKCSVCGNEYKDEQGAGPPGGNTGGGSSDGNKVSFGGIIDFISWVVNGFGSVISAIFDGIGKTVSFIFQDDGGMNFYHNPSTFSGQNVWSYSG